MRQQTKTFTEDKIEDHTERETCSGADLYRLVCEIYPIQRSITGDGVRETLSILSKVYPIEIKEVPSGTKVFDWTVPKEWNCTEAYIKNGKGERIVDYKENNLHVIGYCTPIDEVMNLESLKKILYTLPDQPDVIPYVTSYYKERCGFCITDTLKQSLQEDDYHVVVKSELKNGSLTYGEIIIPGETEEEIFLSTYVCHPSMANNESSGPAVLIHLAKWIAGLKRRKYTYRMILIPETIGSITYLSRNLEHMKQKVKAGFNISCVGDNRTYSYIASRYGSTLADKAAKNVLSFVYPQYNTYSFLKRGSDERQYNAPGVDLPVCVICRSKYGEYPEYHTSADDLTVVSKEGLEGALEVYQECINALEHNETYQVSCFCEPQLGSRGLYPTESYKGSADAVRTMSNLIAYADGSNDLIDISNIIGAPIRELIPIAKVLYEAGLLTCKE